MSRKVPDAERNHASEETTAADKGAKLGKEAKVGLAVLAVLLLCLGGAITWKMLGSSDPSPLADDLGKHSPGALKVPQKDPVKLAAATAVSPPSGAAPRSARPTVVPPAPAANTTPPPVDTSRWSSPARGAEPTGAASGSISGPSPPMPPMPPMPVPELASPRGRYGANFGNDPTSEITSDSSGVAVAGDGAGPAYDPFHGRTLVPSSIGTPPGTGMNPSTAQPDSGDAIKLLAPDTASRLPGGGALPGPPAPESPGDPRDWRRYSTPASGAGGSVPLHSRTQSDAGVAQANAGRTEPYGLQSHGYRAPDPNVTTNPYAMSSRAQNSRSVAGNRDDAESFDPRGASPTQAAAAAPSYANNYALGYGNITPDGAIASDRGTYTVQPNDTYWRISEKLYGTGAYFRALAEHNRRRVPHEDNLQVGDVLLAPDVSELEKKYANLCPKPSRRETLQRHAITVSTSAGYGGRRYVSQEGDTLSDIARMELGKSSRWIEIYELNRELIGPDYNYLPPGLSLVLPVGEASQSDAMTRRDTPGISR